MYVIVMNRLKNPEYPGWIDLKQTNLRQAYILKGPYQK